MNPAPWIVPLLLALGGVLTSIGVMGGPRGGARPFGANGWGIGGLVVFTLAGLLVLLSST